MLIIKNAAGGGSNVITTDDTGNLDVDLYKLYGNEAYPLGSILMYAGKIADLPNEWKVCNGKNGTPDLRNRFIMCAGTPTEANLPHNKVIGGNKDSFCGNHTHKVEIKSAGGHQHNIKIPEFRTDINPQHQHTQHRSPRLGARPSKSTNIPPNGRNLINDGVPYLPSGAAGDHTHSIDLSPANGSNQGGHSHSNIKLSGGTSGSGGSVGANIPKNTKIIMIQKVK